MTDSSPHQPTSQPSDQPSDQAPDDLLDRLRAADPVAGTPLPVATDPAPQQLLASIVDEAAATPATTTGSGRAGTVEDAVVFAELPEIQTSGRARSPRRWQLVTAAAAVLALVAGLLVFSPDNTPTALAAVHQAAEATAEAGTGQIDVSFTLDGTDGTQRAQVSGLVAATFAGPDLAVAVELADVPTDVVGAIPDSVEARLVAGTLYATDGTQWYSVDAPSALGATLIELLDPRAVLDRVQELLETEEIGPATVDGVATTHYRSTVDLGDESLTQAEWLPVGPGDIDAEGAITVDLFVGADGLLRRLTLSGNLQEPDGGAGEATFEVVTTFSKLGGDLTVTAPEGATPIDPSTGQLPFGD